MLIHSPLSSFSLFLSFSLSLFLFLSLSLSLSLSSHRSMIHLLLTHQGGKVRKRKKPWKRSKRKTDCVRGLRIPNCHRKARLLAIESAVLNRVKRFMKDRNVSRKAAQKDDDARHL